MVFWQKAKEFVDEIGAELEKDMAGIATATAALRPTTMIEDALRIEKEKVDRLKEIEKTLVDKMNAFGKELAQARHMLSIYAGAVERLSNFPPAEAAPAPAADPAPQPVTSDPPTDASAA